MSSKLSSRRNLLAADVAANHSTAARIAVGRSWTARIAAICASSRGVTLVELMVVMSVFAILAAIAVPNLQSFVTSSRLRASAENFYGALALARSEAVRRGADARVTVMPVAAGDWSAGFVVFYDTTNNANGGTPPADTALLRKSDPLPASVSVTPTLSNGSTVNYVIFNGLGRSIDAAGTPVSGALGFRASNDTGQPLRCVLIATNGRFRLASGGAGAGATCPT